MKLASIGAVAIVPAAFVNSAQAQIAVEGPGYPARFNSVANSQYSEPGNPYTDDGRDWHRGNANMLHDANGTDRYRYHGGPKSND
jgi:hypothetical protein